MMQLIPFRREHIRPLLAQGINAGIRELYEAGLTDQLEADESSMTVVVDGTPMVCGGAITVWRGRGVVWTVFNEESRFCFLQTIRGIRQFLDLQLKNFRRLEIAVPVDFEIGHRRAKLLGFKVEAPFAPQYLPDGTDCVLYSMVRN